MAVDHDRRVRVGEGAGTSLDALLERLRTYLPAEDLDPVRRAHAFSQEAHRGQTRLSGDPYLSHCTEVAGILADLHLDLATITAALLHDVVEDSEVELDRIRAEFGDPVAGLVDGVTKIGELKLASPEKQQAENFRKMLLSMAQDIRVILIKLADRLHNMRTLEFLAEEKIQRIARETLEIYAPLAHRLGMGAIRVELEDLSFRFLEPEAYASLRRDVATGRGEREGYIETVRGIVQARLEEEGIEAEVTGRAKHLFSIHQKMKRRRVGLDEIHDLIAVRVITQTVGECYHALGVIHTLFRPLHEKFKDYIATPKSNLYRSLHTTAVGPGGRLVEIQIRTEEMHYTCEMGIAAHWRYKDGSESDSRWNEVTGWLKQVLDWQKDYSDPGEFMEMLKIDLFQHEVFVFTPRGELVQLPRGATALDFAFAIHTEVGLHCVGAKVDGRIVPLRTPLESGNKVEIVTSPSGHPSNDWLKITKTSRARSKVRRWIRQTQEAQSVALGKEMLERECRRLKVSIPREKEMPDLANAHGYENVEKFLAAVGRGDISIHQVMNKLAPSRKEKKERPALFSGDTYLRLIRGSTGGVRVEGQDNMMIRFAQCCQPVPGDPIVGIVTRGRGVSVHRVDCFNTFEPAVDPGRLTQVSWNVEGDRRFLVRVGVIAQDRKGLVTDITRKIAETGTNIRAGEFDTEEPHLHLKFLLEVRNLEHLKKVLRSIKRMREVLTVTRSREPS
jgi:guanosine-3',5'-bis(diphosphate) 3'-pyrophosphohydrolase